jgi:hypothetical protein
MKIKRYDMVTVYYCSGEYTKITEHSNGDYVKYEDVEPLLKELEKLRKEKNLL